MVQQVMSKEKTPVLAGTIPAFEQFMTFWEQLGLRNPRVRKYTQEGLDWAYKYYNKMDDTSAYIVSMCMYSSWILMLY
jgi:hypothetical protein